MPNEKCVQKLTWTVHHAYNRIIIVLGLSVQEEHTYFLAIVYMGGIMFSNQSAEYSPFLVLL
jgi:hypothetical protein